MVLIRSIRQRAASVPADEAEYLNNDTALNVRNARIISIAALNDTDSMYTASRMNDEQLLRDINARLENMPVATPSPLLKRSRYTPAYIHKHPLLLATTSHGIKTTASDDRDANDVDKSVELMMPITARLLRAGSVPPAGVTLLTILPQSPAAANINVVTNDVLQNGSVAASVNGPNVLNSSYAYLDEPIVERTSRCYVTGAQIPESFYYCPQSSAHLTPTADLAVRQAHRNLNRIEHELKTDSTLAPPLSPLSPIRTYVTTDIGPRRRSSSYHGNLTSVRARSPSNLLPIYTDADLPSLQLYKYTGHRSNVPSYTTNSKTILCRTTNDLTSPLDAKTLAAKTQPQLSEVHLPTYVVTRNISLAGGSPRTVSTALNLHRTTPISTALRTSTDIDYLIQSARTVSEVPNKVYVSRASSINATANVPSKRVNDTLITPASANSTSLPPVLKPKISETRRRVRDVLCKVKGDPRYFD